jgi:hypothetical protein
MALHPFVGPWNLLQFRNLFTPTVGLLGGGSARRNAATYTEDNKNTEQKQTNIHVLSGIRIHDPSVRGSENSSFLRPCGHCDRPTIFMPNEKTKTKTEAITLVNCFRFRMVSELGSQLQVTAKLLQQICIS